MDTISVVGMTLRLIDFITKSTQQLNETTKSFRQASSEFNSFKKELGTLSLRLEAVAEEMGLSRQVEIPNQRFLIAPNDKIESACRWVEDIKRAPGSAPGSALGRIPDERKTLKWSYHDARSDLTKRLIMDLTTKIQTLNKMIDNAQARARPPQLSYLVGKSTSSLTTEELEIQTADLAIPEFAIPVPLDEYWADLGNIPPVRWEDIRRFWKSLFKVAEAIRGIHDLTFKRGETENYYDGWHTDIKPNNILLIHGEFKLADFGLAKFIKRAEKDAKTPRPYIEGGTEAYGAPEVACDRIKKTKTEVKQTIDIWSFGCVLSEAATWVVLGFQGIEQFRILRMLAAQRCSGTVTDRFHDGDSILPDIKHWHNYLAQHARPGDTITPLVLELIESSMLLKDPDYRLSSSDLCEKLEQVLRHAEAGRISKNRGKKETHDSQRFPNRNFPRYRSSGRSSYSAIKLFGGLVCIGTSSFSSAVLRQYDLTHPTHRCTNADGLGGITVENTAPGISVYKCPWLGLSGKETSLTDPWHFLCQGLKGLHDWTQTFPSLPEAVLNPSPTVFVGSVFTFGLATAAYYQPHKRDKYQDVFLIGGVLTGTVAGWLGNTDIQGVLLSFLPFCILVSLVLSSCIHGVAGPRWQGSLAGLGWIENMGKESGLENPAF